MTYHRMVPRQLPADSVERGDGLILRTGTPERHAWSRALESAVNVARKGNEMRAAGSDPIGAGSMPELKVRKSRKGITTPKLGRKIAQFINVACPACGAEPGYPCNSSVPLEEWEQKDRVHDARVKRVRDAR